MIHTICIGTITGAFCLFGRNLVIGLFLKEPSVASMGAQLILCMVIASPMIGIYNIGANFMQASGNAFTATLVAVLRQGILLIPLLYLMNTLLGFTGIALAHTVADVTASVISFVLIIRQFKKLKKEIQSAGIT